MLQARSVHTVKPTPLQGSRRAQNVVPAALPSPAGGQQLVPKQPVRKELKPPQAILAPSIIAEPTASIQSPAVSTPPAPNSIVELNPSTYQDFITKEAGDALVLVDFYSHHCGPCKLMDSHLHHLTFAFKGIKFAKFNCGLHQEFSTGLRIRSLPTFRLYHRRKCLEQLTGAQPVKLRQLLVHYFRPSRK